MSEPTHWIDDDGALVCSLDTIAVDSVYTLQVFVYLFKTTVSEILAENYKQ